MANRILVVEDDAKLTRVISKFLGEEGYAVETCASGDTAVERLRADTFDLLLLDWMLPDADGVDVCQRVRGTGSDVPIVMLTARGDATDRVRGLDAGADDYVVKPFDVDELLARIRAVLRRRGEPSKIVCGPVEIDRLSQKAKVSGNTLALTGREYALLLYLCQNADRVVGRSELLAHVWETTHDPGTNIVEVHVSRLREKLGEHAFLLETVRGRGYAIVSGATSKSGAA